MMWPGQHAGGSRQGGLLYARDSCRPLPIISFTMDDDAGRVTHGQVKLGSMKHHGGCPLLLHAGTGLPSGPLPLLVIREFRIFCLTRQLARGHDNEITKCKSCKGGGCEGKWTGDIKIGKARDKVLMSLKMDDAKTPNETLSLLYFLESLTSLHPACHWEKRKGVGASANASNLLH